MALYMACSFFHLHQNSPLKIADLQAHSLTLCYPAEYGDAIGLKWFNVKTYSRKCWTIKPHLNISRTG